MQSLIAVLMMLLGLAGCSSSPKKAQSQPSMAASYYDMKDKTFSLQAVAPKEVIREYAICKAVWFAEQKKASKMALGDPAYGGKLKAIGVFSSGIPEGWMVVDTKAYLAEPKGTSNPFVNVGDYAKNCRHGWDWYR